MLSRTTAPKVESDFANAGFFSASLVASRALLYCSLVIRFDSGKFWILDMLASPTALIVVWSAEEGSVFKRSGKYESKPGPCVVPT